MGYTATEEGTSGSRNLVASFIQSYDNLMNKGLIVKSDLQINLLTAHDSIRKMLNKPVYYGVSKTDNFNHVNSAIDNVLSKHKVQLSANDVESIVTELNSMSDIAKKYGVSEEAVYYLKGNFRGD
jgi:phage portal protein BeeE